MYSSETKKPSEKDTFEKAPKKVSVKAKPKKEDEEGVFSETEGKIKSGGLRKSLKIDDDNYKLSKPILNKLLKNETGKEFNFRDKKIKMTDKLKRQLQLALNMMN